MKVVLINNANFGSTGGICKDIVSYLKAKGVTCEFLFGISSSKKHKGFVFSIERLFSVLLTKFTGNLYGFMFFSTKRLIKKIKKIKPDVVHLHCLNAYTANLKMLFLFLAKEKYRVVVTCHSFFYNTGSCGYPYRSCNQWKKGCQQCPNVAYACKSYLINNTKNNWKRMKQNFAQFNNSNLIFTGVSDYVTKVSKISPITSSYPCVTILNGIDVNTFKFCSNNSSDNSILFICSDPKNFNKGFDIFLQVVKLLSKDHFVFHYIGEKDSRLDEFTNVIQHGFLADKKQLADFYSRCSLTLVTSRNETFSLPVAESLCCGTPVAFLKSGGPESIAINPYAIGFDESDLKLLIDYIKNKKYLSFDKIDISNKAIKKYSNVVMCSNYMELYRGLMNEEINK